MNLPVSYRKTSEQALAEATNLEAARIPIEKFSGHGLLFAGDQDAMWPADTAVRELSDRNKNLEGVVYHGAGHLFDEDITPLWANMANDVWRFYRRQPNGENPIGRLTLPAATSLAQLSACLSRSQDPGCGGLPNVIHK